MSNAQKGVGGDLPYSTKDLCWLAGIMEGEGSFHDGCDNIHITTDMTDQDVMEHVSSLMRTKLYGPYNNGPIGRKPKWRVRLTGPEAAGWMMTLYGLLGKRRRARIKELLTDWKSRYSGAKGKSHCLRGHPLSGNNVRLSRDNKRVCRTCARENMAKRRTLARSLNQVVEQIA